MTNGSDDENRVSCSAASWLPCILWWDNYTFDAACAYVRGPRRAQYIACVLFQSRKSQILRFIYPVVGHHQETQLLCFSHEATHERHYHPTAKISHERRRRAGRWMDGLPSRLDAVTIFKNFVGSRKPNQSVVMAVVLCCCAVLVL